MPYRVDPFTGGLVAVPTSGGGSGNATVASAAGTATNPDAQAFLTDLLAVLFASTATGANFDFSGAGYADAVLDVAAIGTDTFAPGDTVNGKTEWVGGSSSLRYSGTAWEKGSYDFDVWTPTETAEPGNETAPWLAAWTGADVTHASVAVLLLVSLGNTVTVNVDGVPQTFTP